MNTARDNLSGLPARFALLRAELASGLSINTNTGRRPMNHSTPPDDATPAPAPIFHRHGGTITAVTHIGHETRHGVADWFYVGDISWRDGSRSAGREISPTLLCHDDTEASRLRVLNLSARLSAYLASAGTWHEPKTKRGGYQVSWTPHTKAGRVPVQS